MSGFNEMLGQILGRVSEHIPVQDPEMAQNIRVHGKIQQHLSGAWLHAQRMRIPCAIRARDPMGRTLRCMEPMAGTCVACRAPTCLHHGASILETGEVICFGCVEVARHAVSGRGQSGEPFSPGSDNRPPSREPPVDTEKLRKKYLKRLKITVSDPTEDEIKIAWKREAAKAHPDRMPAEKKQKAQDRFVLLGEAKDWLLANTNRRAA